MPVVKERIIIEGIDGGKEDIAREKFD